MFALHAELQLREEELAELDQQSTDDGGGGGGGGGSGMDQALLSARSADAEAALETVHRQLEGVLAALVQQQSEHLTWEQRLEQQLRRVASVAPAPALAAGQAATPGGRTLPPTPAASVDWQQALGALGLDTPQHQ